MQFWSTSFPEGLPSLNSLVLGPCFYVVLSLVAGKNKVVNGGELI